MKKRLLWMASLAIAACSLSHAESPFVNLTPAPKQLTVSEQTLTLPAQFAISVADKNLAPEAEKFATTLNAATGIDVTVGSDASAFVMVTTDSSIAPEGYQLEVTVSGINIKASAPAGLFYAFQTIKKVLPANVMAGKLVAGTYSLPVMTVNDEPNYPWRGMEIDVARHFFSVDQIKKMLDVMAVYKMNRLHWHLTDDQGWRIEMPKYPKLTTEVACPVNQYWCDFDTRTSYLTNKPYGPYFYTVDEMKEVVAYAKSLHIEVCPEVDMPGHMQCAIAAYPEFSTVPEAEHPVRYWPGVSQDVLDVSNPAVVQFLKDVIDQLIEIFPYEYIHIGGDECPTNYWKNSASCQAFMAEHGLKSEQAIQNWLTAELAAYCRQKPEEQQRRLICWNEVLTANGADKQMAKDADLLIYAWLGAGSANNPSKQAADLGLRSVWCSTSHYYIDYPQWGGNEEPLSMGGTITLQTVYNAQPDYDASKKELYYGVNCNLWTEYVCEDKHLEYNALPRMLAVAETGWTPRNGKNWDSFLRRFRADAEYLDMAGYTYGRHYLETSAADKVMPTPGSYYRLITRATNQNRANRCIELVADGSSLIADFGATAGLIWTNAQAAKGDSNYDYQYWTFEPDPAGSGMYAMSCRAVPAGSLKSTMSGSSTAARWTYDNNVKHYDFVIGDEYSTLDGQYIYSIRSKTGTTAYLSAATAADKLSVNNWHLPLDGNGGIWFFDLEDYTELPVAGPAFTPLTAGQAYTFESAVFPQSFIRAEGDALSATAADNLCWADRAWTIEDSAFDSATNTQTFKLRSNNGLYIGAAGQPVTTNSQATGYGNGVFSGDLGAAVALTTDASAAAVISMKRASADADEYILTIAPGGQLFSLPHESVHAPGAVNVRPNVPRVQGGTWKVSPAQVVTYTITDGESTHYDLTVVKPDSIVSPLDHFEVESVTERDASHADLLLRRITWPVSYHLMDTEGYDWGTVVTSVVAGSTFTPAAPQLSYLTDGKIEGDAAEAVASSALDFTAVYTAKACRGVAAAGSPVTELKDGHSYLIQDLHEVRHAYRNATSAGTITGAREVNGVGPAYVWTVNKSGSKYTLFNEGTGLYAQKVETSKTGTVATDPYEYRITYNGSKNAWTIKNGTNDLCWDGNEDLRMVGWSSPGHDIAFQEFVCEPYFSITIEERDQTGELLGSRKVYVRPGDDYVFAATSHLGKALVSVEGNDNLTNIDGNRVVTVNYSVELTGIDTISANQQPGIPGAIYDLQGRRLNKVTRPGIYIINGIKTRVNQ